jgi:hypothetical protein
MDEGDRMNKDSLPQDVLDALRAGNKIAAIARLRETRKIGLAEAKALIDHLAQAHKGSHPHPHPHPHAHTPRPRRPGLSPGEVPGSSSSAVTVVLLLAILAFAAWRYLA